jgi:DNA-binding MarR family transcriptional regulator
MAEIKGYDPELERLVEYFHRIWESAILTAALDLDLFGALHDGPRTAGDIASELGLDPKGVRILLDALCPAGFIEKEGDR